MAITVDELRLSNGRVFVPPEPGVATDLVLVHATERTHAPLWGAIPLAVLGAISGAFVGLYLCFEGCRDPALGITAVASIFTLTGAGVGWGLGGLAALALTSPQRATPVDPVDVSSASPRP